MSPIGVALRLIAAASLVSVATAGLPRYALGQDSTAQRPAGAITLPVESADSVKLAPEPLIESSAASDSAESWITRRDALGAGIAILATVAVAPLDRPISGEFREPGWQKAETLHSASHALAFGGGPGPFVLGIGFY